MTREIKFRAWDKKRTSMYTVSGFSFEVGKASLNTDMMGSHWVVELSDIELMQFIGLHDKNDKEIYDGDITPHSETTPPDGTITTHYGVVEWDSSIASFVLRIQEDGSQEELYESCKWFESVGNIYENPELLDA